jgi:pimeloyl-ACP methyl ester carboxylesterase
MSARTITVSAPSGDVPVTVTESGAGSRPVLLLHGGAGPDSVTGFGDALAARFPFRVLSPVYPGFAGTARPGWLDSISELALVLRGLLAEEDLTDVIVAGNSIGGWVAAELALAAPERVGRLVLIDSAGLDSADHPVADFYSLTPDQLADLSWANPEGHRIDPAAMPEAQRAILLGNREALLAYGGRSMADPALAARLGGITAPTLVIWGEADRIVTPGYGKEYAAAIPGAVFREVPAAGHLPQLENPEAVLELFGELVTARSLPVARLAGDGLQVREHQGAVLLIGDVFGGGEGPVRVVPRLSGFPGHRVAAREGLEGESQVPVVDAVVLADVQVPVRVEQRGLGPAEDGVDTRDLPFAAREVRRGRLGNLAPVVAGGVRRVDHAVVVLPGPVLLFHQPPGLVEQLGCEQPFVGDRTCSRRTLRGHGVPHWNSV